MASLVKIFQLSFLASILLVGVNCEFSDILKLCDNESCEVSEAKLLQVNSTDEYRKRMFTLISAGVPQILWQQVRDMRTGKVDIGKNLSISNQCADSLVKVSEGLDEFYEWAYRMIDSSGKTPSALFESTISSFGDYNECLDISTPDFDGQYCMPDLFPLKTQRQHTTWPGPSREERAASGRVNLGDIAVFKGMSFNFALCVPSTCKAEEVRNVLAVVLEPYFLKPAGALSCDTKQSISYATRLSNLTKLQIYSICLISSILVIFWLVSTYHMSKIAWNYHQTGNFTVTVSPLVSAISVVDNVRQLVRPDDKDNRNTVLDLLKFFVVITGVLGHIVICVEIPISYYTLQSQTYHNGIFGSPRAQAFTNEAGMCIITFLGGLTTYSILIPMARKKKLPFFFALFDRWARFAPSVLCITAIEFIWPLLWSGPLFTRVADFTIKKCTETWWKNLIFINNWFPVVDICAGHTYSTSMDFQLFFLGLIATYITVRSVKAGLTFSVTMMIYGWLHTAYNAYTYQTTATLYVPDPIPINIVNYLDYVHMNTAVYIPAYFMGFIAGHYVSNGYRIKLAGIWDHIKVIAAASIPLGIVALLNALYNGFRIIPHSWSPMQININRTLQTLGGAIYFVYFFSLDNFLGYKLNKLEETVTQQKSTSWFSLRSTLTRLSYSVYLSNYVLIKSEFFAQKVLYPADTYLLMKKLFATIIMSMFRFFLLSSLTSILLTGVNCKLSDILTLCENETCEVSEATLMQLNSTAGHRKRMFTLISAGVPQILWQRLKDMRTEEVNIGRTFSISNQCADSLRDVSEGLDELYEWAYRIDETQTWSYRCSASNYSLILTVIDSSGKTPSALFESTLSSFGDYNECLDINTPSFTGQYCMPDLFPVKTKRQHATWPGPSRKERAASGRVNLGDIAVFRGLSFNFGLCVPSTCTAGEIRNILAIVLEPYLLSPAGAVSCDTKKSISYETRLSNLTKLQVYSICFITAILITIASVSVYHASKVIWNYNQTGTLTARVSPLVSAISVIDNVQQLVRPDGKGIRTDVLDFSKFAIVFTGVIGHIVICVEIPTSVHVLTSLTFYNDFVGSAIAQPLTNEAGMCIITLLGGLATYSILMPMARKKKLPFFFALFDRWARFAPSVLCITAIEFIWPILWSGPLFTRVADFTVEKCTETWWKNLIFINNWFPAEDICAGHTYSVSMDFQLFFLGLIATYITVRSVKAGLTFSVTMMIYGWLHTAYNAYTYETTATLYVPDPIPMKVVQYLNYVHMSTPVYMPAYFMGFLVGHYLSTGYRMKLEVIQDHIKVIAAITVSAGIVAGQNILYNGFRLIPHSWSPMQININRTLQTLCSAISLVYFFSLDEVFGYKLDKTDNDVGQQKSTSWFSLRSTLTRLSYSVYLSNYVLIKSEFFAQKTLYPADMYLVLKKCFATTMMVILVAFVFQLLFVSPFNNVRRILFDRKASSENNNKEQIKTE
ncbi:Nose resistant to fluoxetine protein 6 [Halotydeus destructor]|nr:Nose resistant to fluoxetine protein 6 [Halotydeus destructor]